MEDYLKLFETHQEYEAYSGGWGDDISQCIVLRG